MAEEHGKVKPLIDDEFWFNYSKTKVTDAMKARIDAAAKLQASITWLWGIYTASASVGIALSKTSYPLPVILLIALPSPILIGAYMLATWAQIPVTIGFKEVVPNTIKEAYAQELKVKTDRINKAVALSFIAALLVSVALVGASVSKQTTPPNFQAFVHAKDGSNSVAVSGLFPADTNVIVRVAPIGKARATEEFPGITSKAGELQMASKLKSADNKYDVTVAWKDKDTTYSLKRAIVSQNKEKPKEK